MAFRITRGILLLIALLSRTTKAADEAPIYDVPRLDGITIDGNDTDWANRGLVVDQLVDSAHSLRSAGDFDARLRLGWNDQGLLVLLRVWDDVPLETAHRRELWRGDSVDLYLTPGAGSKQVWQLTISPGVDPAHPQPRKRILDMRTDLALKAIKIAPQFARSTAPGGYFLEALLPWDSLGIKPELGREVGFQIGINDFDGGSITRAQWHPLNGTLANSHAAQQVRLAAEAGAPVIACAGIHDEQYRRMHVKVVADEQLAGKTVQVECNGKPLGDATLQLQEESGFRSRAFAMLDIPRPPPGKPYQPLLIKVDQQVIDRFNYASSDDGKVDEIAYTPFLFQPGVFSGNGFPSGDFKDPWKMVDLIGPYSLKIDFYDRDFHPVKTASRPGRYGAIVTATAASGKVYRRFVTLFRTPGSAVEWSQQHLASQWQLPKAWGIDPAVVELQTNAIDHLINWNQYQACDHDIDEPVVLAALYEAKPADTRWNDVTGPFAIDQRWWYTLQNMTGTAKPYKHLDCIPASYAADQTKRWPMILFLHGSGERGDDLSVLMRFVKPIVEGLPDRPFVVIAPQCPPGQYWNALRVNDVLEEAVKKYRIDPDRIYLTGLSMGGFGTWATAATFPDRFAAIAPVCGGGDPATLKPLQNIPVWMGHGSEDGNVDFHESQRMWDELKKIGGHARFTVYPGYTHDVWTPFYANADFYRWLLSQTRRHPQQPVATEPDQAPPVADD